MKKIIFFLVLFILGLCTDVEAKNKSYVLFNTEPITEYNVSSCKKIFSPEKRIYYLFIAPKRMSNKYIRVQVFKFNDKDAGGGAEVLRTMDFRLMKDQRYYHSDYFVLNSKGRYVLQVFSMNDLQRPLAFNDFYVK